MEEEKNMEDNINIYCANFEYEGNDKKILEIYKMKEKVENNDIISKKIIKRKYNHPLILNYNYCLFCLERRYTKFNQKNLYDNHNIRDKDDIELFFKNKNIKLKQTDNKNEKLAKRRFIHSYDNEKNIISINKHSESDTELFIQENEKVNLTKEKSTSLPIHKSSTSINFVNRKPTRINPSKFDIALRKPFIAPSLIPKNNFKDRYNSNEKKENMIFQRRRNLKSTKNINPFSFLGFVSDSSNRNKNNETNDFFLNQTEKTLINSVQYYEKNEKCRICTCEIKDKFTLLCGDFFCRECIVNLLKESINDITIFNQLNCPLCKEPINENTIKFLLKGKTLQKYNKLKTRIEGLKNPNNIPCPYPDCEGFATKEEERNGTYKCQNNHIFCKKCLEVIEETDHNCEKKDKYPETTKYLNTNKNIRKCPKCRCWVKRDKKGCNYFKCINIWCNYEFCWICGNKYEPSHYRNPLSTCFRLQESEFQGRLIESNRIRRLRCILIILLLVLILLPIICIFFSFFGIILFVLYFYFDGKELRNARLKSKIAHKIFYVVYFLFIFFIALSLIPFGYMCLAVLIFAIPIIIIVKKVRKKKYDF